MNYIVFVGSKSIIDSSLGYKIFPYRGANIRFRRYRGVNKCKILLITELI